MKDKFRNLIGNLPKESGFKKRMRFHQTWWRTSVLVESTGKHPQRKSESLGNVLPASAERYKNFLSEKTSQVVEDTLRERQLNGLGIIEEERLFRNLLSSQPLCFNFFGELKYNLDLALSVLRNFYPDLTRVTNVRFEFAPLNRYTHDNSAFDVAFDVRAGARTGLVGLECKYTDTFSQTEYDKPAYRDIFRQAKDVMFSAPYEKYTSARFNQLFRNQLLAAALVQNREYDFVLTGLFHHHDDKVSEDIAREFRSMLTRGASGFQVITYRDYLESLQQTKLTWEQREWSMLLWARYCGLQLSEAAFV